MAEKNWQGKDFYPRVMMLLQTGSFAEAERLCLLLLESDPTDPSAWFYLGVAKQFQHKVSEALASFSQAALFEPRRVDVLNAMASCYEQLGHMQDAYDTLCKACELDPQNPDIRANMAVALAKLDKHQDALKQYDRALQLNPSNRTSLINRGALLTRLGSRHQGLEHYLKAYEIYPDDVDILYNLVDALIGMFAYKEALVYCDIGLKQKPRHAYLLFKKGMALSCLGHFFEAREAISKSQVLQPGILRDLLPYLRDPGYGSVYVDARTLYLEAMYEEQRRCFWKNRERYIDELSKSIVEPASTHETLRHREFCFAILSLNINAQTRLTFMRSVSEYIQDAAWLQATPPFVHASRSSQRLRIGYVSPDFRKHPIGLLTRQLYKLHNREDFEVIGYSLLSPEQDSVYQSISTSCDLFRDLSRLDPKDAARLIHEDAIDILIDLAGYTTYSRTEIFAHRPAPLQIAYLGYMGTMGADFIDYAVLDKTLCPGNSHVDWHEAPLKLPHSQLVYDSAILNAPCPISRLEHNLPDKGIVFCCLNTSYKIEPRVFSVWMRILQQVNNSVLWLAASDPHTMENLKTEAVRGGVSAMRLVFAENLPLDRHLPRYQLADLFLDTFWHNAHTTAADALWQGLPVLTCMGKVASSRIAASLLVALEVPELITHSMQEYEEKAVYYATHPEALNALKHKVRSKRDSAPLFDVPRTVRALERGYKMAWQRLQDGLPPAAIDVPDEIAEGVLIEPV